MKRKTTDAGRHGPRPRTKSAAPPPQSAVIALRVRQIAFAITLLAAGLGPLAPSFEGNPVLRLIIQMFFILSGATWVIAMALEGRVRIRNTGLEVILLLLAGALVCGCINAVYKYPAMLTLFSWLSAMVAFVFLVNETRSRWRRLMVLLMIGAATFTISLHGLHQITVDLPRARAIFAQDPDAVLRDLRLPADAAFDLFGRLEKDRIFSTFFLPNSLAGFLILLAPALIGLVLDWWKSRPAPIGGESDGDASGVPAPGSGFRGRPRRAAFHTPASLSGRDCFFRCCWPSTSRSPRAAGWLFCWRRSSSRSGRLGRCCGGGGCKFSESARA